MHRTSKEKVPESHKPLAQGQGQDQPESLADQNPKGNPKISDPKLDLPTQEKVLATPREDLQKSLSKA